MKSKNVKKFLWTGLCLVILVTGLYVYGVYLERQKGPSFILIEENKKEGSLNKITKLKEENKKIDELVNQLVYEPVRNYLLSTTTLNGFSVEMQKNGKVKYLQITEGLSDSIEKKINQDIMKIATSLGKKEYYCDDFSQGDRLIYIDSTNLIFLRSSEMQCGMTHPEAYSSLFVYDLKTGERVSLIMNDKNTFLKLYTYFNSIDKEGYYFQKSCDLRNSFETGNTVIRYGGVTDKGLLVDIINNEGFPKFMSCSMNGLLVPANVININDFVKQ